MLQEWKDCKNHFNLFDRQFQKTIEYFTRLKIREITRKLKRKPSRKGGFCVEWIGALFKINN